MGKTYARILRGKVNTFRSTLRPFLRPLLHIPPSRSLKVSCCRVPVTLLPDKANLSCAAFALRKMREVISVHVGQAGVQIGNACCKFSKILPLRWIRICKPA
jgi:hypothetical protein